MLVTSRARARTLCFIGGHGERTPQSSDDRSGYSEVAKSLEKENFRVTHVYGLTEVYGPATICAWHQDWDAFDSGDTR